MAYKIPLKNQGVHVEISTILTVSFFIIETCRRLVLAVCAGHGYVEAHPAKLLGFKEHVGTIIRANCRAIKSECK